ncbi:MAG: hypothetical protein NTV72_00645 [Candidatus Taylorbacteria bacterium]|nr:hypothetical protein [Candidatus Taylorbacteria bacterium]
MINRTRSLLRSLFWALISFLAFAILGEVFHKKLGEPSPVWFASSILISMLAHEFTHWLMYEMSGIRANIICAVVLAITIPDKDSAKALSKLPWRRNFLLLLAGIPGTAILIAVSWILAKNGEMSWQHFEQICFINGNIVMFDLIIPAAADGSKVMRRLLASAPVGATAFIQKTAFGIIGLTVMMYISAKGNRFPSYWGMILITDCWFGHELSVWFRRHAWPWMRKYQWSRFILGQLINKYGEKPEEYDYHFSEWERLCWLAVYLVVLIAGAAMKYLAVF